MNNTKTLKFCSHGIQKNKPCFFCANGGVYFQNDAAIYEQIYRKSGYASFELAFEIAKRIKKWKKAIQEISLECYFKEIERIKNFGWGLNSLKKAYYVTREFPDLIKREKRILSFSDYKEIVTARLSSTEKHEIRQIAEREGLKSKELRRLIKQYQKKEITENKYKKERIIFHTENDFLGKVKDFLQENNDLETGTIIVLEIEKGGDIDG